MENIDDYELIDKDFERFLQIGRETYEFEKREIRSEPAEKGDNRNI